MSLPKFAIDALRIPASSSDADAAEFIEMVDVRNAIETDVLGSDALSVTADELLPVYTAQHYKQRQVFAARVGRRMVGRAILSWSSADDRRVAWVVGEVLRDYRGRGIGTALFEHVEELALGVGRSVIQARAIHGGSTSGELLASPTGYGSVPANDPGVRFMLRRGYRLEQVKRISFLDLPVGPESLEERRQRAADTAGPDYRLIPWTGPTPASRTTDMAKLRSRMSADDPSAALDVSRESWDEARVVVHDRNRETGGRPTLTATIEHVPSGLLVGFSELTASHDLRPARQGETFVLSRHRGHRLGTLLKVVNLQALALAQPQAPLVYAFNAEENRPMLDVNEALGFRAVGFEGAWKRG